MKKGLIIGKFLPVHKGHEYLIEYALQRCDKLYILFAAEECEPIDSTKRGIWLTRLYGDNTKIHIYTDIFKHPGIYGDELSRWWGNRINSRYGKFDVVFSSESYGEEFAKTLGAENDVCDLNRETVPISASVIREKPYTYWNYISDPAKPHFVKRICIVGTESTGKTTLCQQLAEHYNTNWAHEVGRDFIPYTKHCTIGDLMTVGYEHINNIFNKEKEANKILFVDTDLHITKSYSKFLFGEIPVWPYWTYEAGDMDLRIFLNSDHPYIDDGTRLSFEDRKLLEESHLKTYEEENIPLERFSYKGRYDKRFNEIINCIDNFLEKY